MRTRATERPPLQDRKERKINENTRHVLCQCPRSMIQTKRWLDEEIVSTREVKKLRVDKIAKFLGEVNPWKIT